jgi:glycosyltransferase involved in cell wall biosynthesis
MKVLALTKYGSLAASTRQRFEQYELALAAAGITVDYAPLLGNAHLERLVAGRRASPLAVFSAYWSRLRSLVAARNYDALWVHCELFPYWPGFMERLVTLPGKPVVFDYDDAIFHMYDSSRHPLVRRLLGRKLQPLLMRATACCCGNDYLRDYAAQYCRRTMVVPTVVDTDRFRPCGQLRDVPLVIGWIGSPSTWAFVRPLLPLLRGIAEEFGVVIRAVGAGDAAERDRFPGLDLVAWSEASEIAAIQVMDIGIMPVPDGPFQRGKCGYKLVQYMACGLPVVASPIGVNRSIVETGRNGYLAQTESEWRDALVSLIKNAELRARLGQAGRARAVADFSLTGQAPRMVKLFHSLREVESE